MPILITEATLPGMDTAALEAGADAFLRKPLEYKAAVQTLTGKNPQ